MNLFSELNELFGESREAERIGEVIWLSSSGTIGVEVWGEGVVECRSIDGDWELGNKVFIKGQDIIRRVPDLPLVTLYLD